MVFPDKINFNQIYAEKLFWCVKTHNTIYQLPCLIEITVTDVQLLMWEKITKWITSKELANVIYLIVICLKKFWNVTKNNFPPRNHIRDKYSFTANCIPCRLHDSHIAQFTLNPTLIWINTYKRMDWQLLLQLASI